MNNIKNITIRNYRGIRYAEVSDMARVNVFLGNNNCGKSSVLESVLMLLGANSPASVSYTHLTLPTNREV